MPIIIGITFKCELCHRQESCNKWSKEVLDPGYIDITYEIDYFKRRGWSTGFKNNYCRECNRKMHAEGAIANG
jgi:hypothetical protein